MAAGAAARLLGGICRDLHLRSALPAAAGGSRAGGSFGWTGLACSCCCCPACGRGGRARELAQGAAVSIAMARRLRRCAIGTSWRALAGWPFLLLLTVTGTMLALPEQSDAVLAGQRACRCELFACPCPPTPRRAYPNSAPAQAMRAAQAALPAARVAWIETPPASGGCLPARGCRCRAIPSRRFPHPSSGSTGRTGGAGGGGYPRAASGNPAQRLAAPAA